MKSQKPPCISRLTSSSRNIWNLGEIYRFASDQDPPPYYLVFEDLFGFLTFGYRKPLFLVCFIKATLNVFSLSFSLYPSLTPFLSLPTLLLSLCLFPSVFLCVYVCLSVSSVLVKSPVIFHPISLFLHNHIRIHYLYIHCKWTFLSCQPVPK